MSSGYFTDNITLIQSSFPVNMLNKVNVKSPHRHDLLSSFIPATFEEDPLPTVLLKACIDRLLDTITNIINVSLKTSIFYRLFLTCALLKKTTLDNSESSFARWMSCCIMTMHGSMQDPGGAFCVLEITGWGLPCPQ